jgi:small subunit ribosomal protein S5
MNGDWVPLTRLGQLVRSGEITNMHDALASGLPLREPEIVDVLLPNMEDEVLDVNMVQRMTDSGRRVRFSITVVVGNRDGYVGIGQFKGKEVGPSIRKAINNAKLNLIEVRRGCGSWECGCGTSHTIPYQVRGKASSVEVVLKPAPRGVGLATGDVAKHVLRLAGFEDVWAFTRGQTRTTVNYAKAVFKALDQLKTVRVREGQAMAFGIREGSVEI